MKFRIPLLLLVVTTNFAFAQTRNVAVDSLEHIKIDSIVFYDDPYIISNAIHENKGFIPSWKNAFDASSNPLTFERNAKKAMPYMHNSLNASESDLQKFYNTWIQQPDTTIELTTYILCDIYFTDLSSQIHYIYSPAWGERYDLPVRLSELDTSKLGLVYRNELNISDAYYRFYRDDHGTYEFFIFEDNVYKKCDALLLYNILKWDFKSLSGTFNSAKGLINFINRQECYIRSRTEDNQRIFERVKNTSNGLEILNDINSK